MSQTGFTRASTLGPIADFVQESGGSIEQVFQRADLPLGILETPDALVPLREHFRLLDLAARDVGDELFSARLGQLVSTNDLGVFGKWITQAVCLHEAILRANSGLSYMMQSATQLVLKRKGSQAVWAYELSDPAVEGRQQNILLALSHMVAVVRHYLGADWSPEAVVICGAPVHAKGKLEQVVGTHVSFNQADSAIVFDWRLLASLNPDKPRQVAGLDSQDLDRAFGVPDPSNFAETVSALIALELLDRYPTLSWVSAKACLTERTLQRRLAAHGIQFSELVQQNLQRRAFSLLRHTDLSMTEIAGRLGYSDSAHFARAFERWTSMPPSGWRALQPGDRPQRTMFFRR